MVESASAEEIIKLLEEDRVTEAEAAAILYLNRSPGNAELLNLRGLIAVRTGDAGAAVTWFESAIKSAPVCIEYHRNKALALWADERGDEAIDAILVAVQLESGGEDWGVLARFLFAKSRPAEAIAAAKRAFESTEDFGPIAGRIAEGYFELRQFRSCARWWRRLLMLQPENGAAMTNLAGVYCNLGRLSTGRRLLEQAAQTAGGGQWALSNLLLVMHYEDASPRRIFEMHRKWSARFEPPKPPKLSLSRRWKRRLSVGYVSSDFKAHSVSRFFEPILRAHDTHDFDIHCFSNVCAADPVTRRLERLCPNFHTIASLDDDAAADLIQEIGIDVLVDLNGHTAGNRLGIFPRRPAPIQATYLGYPDTTGLDSIQYRFTDSIADPPGISDRLHTEALRRLEPCFLTYLPPVMTIPVSEAPCLSKDVFTFGSFAIREKLNRAVLETWATIMRMAPTTNLLLKCWSYADPDVGDGVIRFLESRGIARSRVLVRRPTPTIREHLAHYSDVDVILDTFPYNGTTTTCEALWMGVPVLTLTGQTHAARVGTSILTNCKCSELITTTRDAYVARAIELSQDKLGTVELRNRLRGKLAASPIRRPKLLVRSLEDHYRKMWRE